MCLFSVCAVEEPAQRGQRHEASAARVRFALQWSNLSFALRRPRFSWPQLFVVLHGLSS
jgi:hypothetical protein